MSTAVIGIEIIDLKTVDWEKNGFTAAWRAGNNNHSGAHETAGTLAAKIALCPGTHIARQLFANRCPMLIYDPKRLQTLECSFRPLVGKSFLLHTKFGHLRRIGGVHCCPAKLSLPDHTAESIIRQLLLARGWRRIARSVATTAESAALNRQIDHLERALGVADVAGK